MPERPAPPSEERARPEPPALSIAVRRHSLVTALARALHGPCGMPVGSRVILGVSGGADSSALLVAAAVLARRRTSRVQPIVVHVHHHLRREADDDESFVRGLADRCAVQFVAEHVTVRPARARQRGSATRNLLALARERRYEALVRAAREHDATAIATAHHLDDQCETVLMHLFRGCDLAGLAGMPGRRELGPGIALIRPLLGVRRAACEDLCREAGVTWRDDPGNRDADRTRAMLRHRILPQIEAAWPGAAAHIAAMASGIRPAQRSVEEQVERLFGSASTTSWRRQDLADAPPGLVSAGLRRTALALSASACPTRRHLESAAAAIGDVERRPRRFSWPGNLQLSVTSNRVALRIGGSDG